MKHRAGWVLVLVLVPVVACGGPPRPPAPPAVTAVLVRPTAFSIAVGESRTVCGFGRYASGRVAMRSVDRAGCDSIYGEAFTVDERAVTGSEQRHADASGCYAWLSTDPAIFTVTPAAIGHGTATTRGIAPGRGTLHLRRCE